MRTVLVLLSCTAIALAATSPKVRETEADGHRHHRGGRWGGWNGGANPIVDRNVCDLDASVLVVVEGGRRGRNKARRVKCADVAAADEDSCMVCCQNAARRDQSTRNEDIFGFLSVIDHFDKDSHSDSWEDSHDDDYARREKRGVEEKAAEYKRGDRDSLENFEPIKNFRNLKCLCCAPRRQLPPPPVYAVPVPVPTWGAYQAYAQPPQQPQQHSSPPVAPATGYTVPAAAAPQPYSAGAN
ncbi:hypothetical protein PENTCL1PPCAC_26391 [Pristionchus entomophagus]|uniref:Uncharacterized protein n=1 Tax=Pristionchus entomophagus TaxID=358040 RepID=A0AAV5UCH8_9BILA|nr:hypothetical protein PENTCL1PPCAC_26391 [Pristionchus entomophagus]